jgi:hypothetical protein
MKKATKWGLAGSVVAVLLATFCFVVPGCFPLLSAFLWLCYPVYWLIVKVFGWLGSHGDQSFGVAIVSWYGCCAVLLAAIGFIAGSLLSRVVKSR